MANYFIHFHSETAAQQENEKAYSNKSGLDQEDRN